jgi:hypothetical protein
MATIIGEDYSGNAATATTLASESGLSIFFPTITLAEDGNLLSVAIGSTGTCNFSFVTPPGFHTLISAVLVASTGEAGAAGAGKSITLNSSFGAVAALNNATELTTSPTITIPAVNTNFTIDVSGVLTGLTANTFGGIKITHNTIGGEVNYTGLLLTYN